MTWYELFAFCAWDGGRLPTLAERMYAGAGGDEQRHYPWSSPPKSEIVGTDFAIYSPDAFHPLFTDPAEVGSLSKGRGRWSHADLGGNIAELVLDAWTSDPPATCNDCASIASGSETARAIVDGSFGAGETNLQTAFSDIYDAPDRSAAAGGRCARDE